MDKVRVGPATDNSVYVKVQGSDAAYLSVAAAEELARKLLAAAEEARRAAGTLRRGPGPVARRLAHATDYGRVATGAGR